MCAIIGWAGLLPKGFLTSALIAAQIRGRDATGIAYRSKDGPDGKARTLVVKRAVNADSFVHANKDTIKAARGSARGIAHVRRASPGMVKDDANAHPFIEGKYIYCHNGGIANWRDVCKARGVTVSTDSMLIGPCLESLDFSDLRGSMAIAWMFRNELRVVRHNKELTAATFSYVPTEGEPSRVTVVASTSAIIGAALDRVDENVDVLDLNWHDLAENLVYSVTESGVHALEDEAKFNSAAGDAALDKFTSGEQR